MLGLAHGVDRFVEMSAEMELIMDDVCLRQHSLHGFAVGAPDIHGHGFDPRLLRGIETLQQLPRLFFLATLHQVPDPATVGIVEHGGVSMPAPKILLVQPQAGDRFALPLLQGFRRSASLKRGITRSVEADSKMNR